MKKACFACGDTLKEIPNYRNGNLTRAKCVKCRKHCIVFIDEI